MEKKTILGVNFSRNSGGNKWANGWTCDDDRMITVFTSPKAPDYEEKNWGVNWPGKGTKPPMETLEFAHRLMAAAMLAQEMELASERDKSQK